MRTYKGVLKSGRVTFSPQLPRGNTTALAAMNMMGASKFVYAFSERFWPLEMTYMCHVGEFPRWWTSTFGREDVTEHVLSCFVTAATADKLDQLTDDVALERGLQELSSLLSKPPSAIKSKYIFLICCRPDRSRLAWCKRVSWSKDPYTLGGYATVAVGNRPEVRNKALIIFIYDLL